MSANNSTRNADGYVPFDTDPTLADALASKSPGDECEVEMTIQILSKDQNGMSFNIKPGTLTVEGYEREQPADSDDNSSGGAVETPPAQPPGSLGTAPVVTAMRLVKKGSK